MSPPSQGKRGRRKTKDEDNDDDEYRRKRDKNNLVKLTSSIFLFLTKFSSTILVKEIKNFFKQNFELIFGFFNDVLSCKSFIY